MGWRHSPEPRRRWRQHDEAGVTGGRVATDFVLCFLEVVTRGLECAKASLVLFSNARRPALFFFTSICQTATAHSAACGLRGWKGLDYPQRCPLNTTLQMNSTVLLQTISSSNINFAATVTSIFCPPSVVGLSRVTRRPCRSPSWRLAFVPYAFLYKIFSHIYCSL
jgi:hypothetical protein